jgi:hypothetical protein
MGLDTPLNNIMPLRCNLLKILGKSLKDIVYKNRVDGPQKVNVDHLVHNQG